MILEKEVTVSKQGGMSINIPKQMCKSLDIKAGDKLALIMDSDTSLITMFKLNEPKIYKIQKPIYGDMTECLVYDEKKDEVFPLAFDKELAKLFKDDYKIYVEGFIDENKKFNIIKKVGEQTW